MVNKHGRHYPFSIGRRSSTRQKLDGVKLFRDRPHCDLTRIKKNKKAFFFRAIFCSNFVDEPLENNLQIQNMLIF